MSDGSKSEHSGRKEGAGWQTHKRPLGKESLTLYGQPFKEIKKQQSVEIFLDSEAAIKKVKCARGGAGQAITSQIHEIARKLMGREHLVAIR